jgi:hypothetical protein
MIFGKLSIIVNDIELVSPQYLFGAMDGFTHTISSSPYLYYVTYIALATIIVVMKAVRDVVSFNFKGSYFDGKVREGWWNEQVAWKNKHHVKGTFLKPLRLYLKRTILVTFTSAFHAVESISQLCFSIIIYLASRDLLLAAIPWVMRLVLFGFIYNKFRNYGKPRTPRSLQRIGVDSSGTDTNDNATI